MAINVKVLCTLKKLWIGVCGLVQYLAKGIYTLELLPREKSCSKLSCLRKRLSFFKKWQKSYVLTTWGHSRTRFLGPRLLRRGSQGETGEAKRADYCLEPPVPLTLATKLVVLGWGGAGRQWSGEVFACWCQLCSSLCPVGTTLVLSGLLAFLQ